jgi:F-type H+-transporting ATPase subunit delta
MASTIARRYAEAYFALARESGRIAEWREELLRAQDALRNDEVAAALVNPRLALADRSNLALNLLDGLREPVRNLVRLLIERRRIHLLGDVLSEFDRLADAASGVVRAEVRTATPVTGELRARITSGLIARLGRPVEVEVLEDPSIIGGLVVRVGDRVIDTSIRTQLQQLQTALL